MGTFASSVPGLYGGLLGLIKEAASEQPVEPTVTEFELGQYEPASYVIVGPIAGPTYDWESVPMQMREIFDIHGKATVFTGESPANTPSVALEVLEDTFALLQACVMGPAIEHRTYPTFGWKGAAVQIMLPLESRYEGGLEIIGNQPGGWGGVIDWGIHFEVVLNPVPFI